MIQPDRKYKAMLLSESEEHDYTTNPLFQPFQVAKIHN